MTATTLLQALALLLAAALAAVAYRRAWIAAGRTTTPTGFGVIFAPALLAAFGTAGAPKAWLWAGATILIATVVYWIDDLKGLSARLRLVISFVTGCAVTALVLSGTGWPPALVVGTALAGGVACVALTQVTNFYDGADLNLATTVALLCGATVLASPGGEYAAAGATGLLAALIPFAVLNARPQTLYLGDAGSFAVATFAVLCAAAWLGGIEGLDPAFALPLALPVLDTFFVFCIRIAERHDLLTRNYLHLYQRLQRTRPGFAYLLPQVAVLPPTVATTFTLRGLGLDDLTSVVAAAALIVVPAYFLMRRVFLPPHQREPGEAERLRKFCVVGLGGHARTKLIPALQANGQAVVAVVTSRPEHAPEGAAVHADLESALSELTKDVAFLIATPPSAHDAQVVRVLEAGHDVVVEKPAFVTPRAAVRAAELAAERKRVLVEGFMHRHTPLHHRLLADWAQMRRRARQVSIRFLIPEMPAGTFRQGGRPGDSVLYDVGAYVVSLVQDLGLDPGTLTPADGSCAPASADRISLVGGGSSLMIRADFGLGLPYENSVTIDLADGSSRTYAPCFYGRPGPRTVSGSDCEERIEAPDAFRTMLSHSADTWLDGQPARLARSVKAAAVLHRLANFGTPRRP